VILISNQSRDTFSGGFVSLRPPGNGWPLPLLYAHTVNHRNTLS